MKWDDLHDDEKVIFVGCAVGLGGGILVLLWAVFGG